MSPPQVCTATTTPTTISAARGRSSARLETTSPTSHDLDRADATAPGDPSQPSNVVLDSSSAGPGDRLRAIWVDEQHDPPLTAPVFTGGPWVLAIRAAGRTLSTERLEGDTREVASAIRQRATEAGLSKQKRTTANACATYYTYTAAYLDYPTALARAWAVASTVNDGTCRHPMDIIGARWSVNGSETVLKRQAVRVDDDVDGYWRFHVGWERSKSTGSAMPTRVPPTAD